MKTFPLSAFLSLVTGRSWGEFHEMHGLAEHVMGHPIWTHEFASEKLWTEMRARVLAAHPTLAGVGDGSDLSPENVGERLAAAVAKHGEHLAMPEGHTKRTMSPVATAAAMVSADKVMTFDPSGDSDA